MAWLIKMRQGMYPAMMRDGLRKNGAGTMRKLSHLYPVVFDHLPVCAREDPNLELIEIKTDEIDTWRKHEHECREEAMAALAANKEKLRLKRMQVIADVPAALPTVAPSASSKKKSGFRHG